MNTNISGDIKTLIHTYLSSKIPTSKVIRYFDDNQDKLEEYTEELQKTIDVYNSLRGEIENIDVLVNCIELNSVFNKNLPNYKNLLKGLLADKQLTVNVFSLLRDSSYFDEVWQIVEVEKLTVNILILIYRTTLLLSYKDLLIDSNGNNRVQISSAIEEIIYYRKVQGDKSILFPAVRFWLENWKDEGFDKRLYDLVIEKD